MRVFFVIALGCLCTAVAAAERQPAPWPGVVPQTVQQPAGATADAPCDPPQDDSGDATTPSPVPTESALLPDETRNKVRDVLECIGATNLDSPPPCFKCELLAINPLRSTSIWGNKVWVPLGKADVTEGKWRVVKEATWAALADWWPRCREWYSPATGLRVTFPSDYKNSSVPAGQYVILLFFDTKTLEYYYKSKDKSQVAYGTCRIYDNRPWRDILTNAGISLARQARLSSESFARWQLAFACRSE